MDLERDEKKRKASMDSKHIEILERRLTIDERRITADEAREAREEVTKKQAMEKNLVLQLLEKLAEKLS